MAKLFQNKNSSILNDYNNSSHPNDIIDLSTDPTLLTMYNNIKPENSLISGGGMSLVDRYYKEYGYTSMVGDLAGYLTGVKSPTDLIQTGISKLATGASRGGINSFLFSVANQVLRNPFIENTINNFLASPFDFSTATGVELQLIPSEQFIEVNHQKYFNANVGSNIDGSILGSIFKPIVSSIISSVANSGRLGMSDATQLLAGGLNANEIMQLSRDGIKYTKAAGFFDPTRPIWNSKLLKNWSEDPENVYTYDKFTHMGDGSLSYSLTRDTQFGDDSKLGDSILQRWQKRQDEITENDYKLNKLVATTIDSNPPYISPVSLGAPGGGLGSLGKSSNGIFNNIIQNNADKVKGYQQSLGSSPNTDESLEGTYTAQEEISIRMQRLGFTRGESYVGSTAQIDRNLGHGDADKINVLDVGDDYPEGTADIIKFIFEDISSKPGIDIPIIFRAILTGIKDNIKPTWNETNYLGRPDQFYTYNGITRDINFSLSVYIGSVNKITSQWKKINRLAGLCYPIEFGVGKGMKAPIIRLTIGDLYKRIYGFISDFSVDIPDEAFWDTEAGRQLPQLINIGISFTVMFENDQPRTDVAHFINESLGKIKINDKEDYLMIERKNK